MNLSLEWNIFHVYWGLFNPVERPDAVNRAIERFLGPARLAEERAANGDKGPFGVSWWGVGNESWGCGGDFTPEEYSTEFRRFTSWVPGYGVPLAFVGSGPNSGEVEWTRRFFAALAATVLAEYRPDGDGDLLSMVGVSTVSANGGTVMSNGGLSYFDISSLSTGGALWGLGPDAHELLDIVRARGGVADPVLRQRRKLRVDRGFRAPWGAGPLRVVSRRMDRSHHRHRLEMRAVAAGLAGEGDRRGPAVARWACGAGAGAIGDQEF
mgnify:CR=1 FL=1